jgi:hypothetical protein
MPKLSLLHGVLITCGLIATMILAVLLSGCTPPAAASEAPAATSPVTPPAPNVHVVNSAWEVVREDVLASAKSITSTDELQASIDAYNATHTDDQWRLIYGDVPPIAEAPTVDAYIVTCDTHELATEYHDIARADLVARRDAWRLQVEVSGAEMGSECVLYVDNVPPAPIPVTPPDPYVTYAIYALDAGDVVLYEEHPAAADYGTRLYAWNLTIEVQNTTDPAHPWHIVTGRLWP